MDQKTPIAYRSFILIAHKPVPYNWGERVVLLFHLQNIQLKLLLTFVPSTVDETGCDRPMARIGSYPKTRRPI